MHDLRDLAGRTRRALISTAIGVGGVILIVFGIEALVLRHRYYANGFDVWMMFVGVVGLAVASFHVLERVAHHPRLPRAVAIYSVNSRMPADAPPSQPSR